MKYISVEKIKSHVRHNYPMDVIDLMEWIDEASKSGEVVADEEFLQRLEHCARYTTCAGCPGRGSCKGSYDMLRKTFAYVRELEAKIASM
jgi:hypothetical protein